MNAAPEAGDARRPDSTRSASWSSQAIDAVRTHPLTLGVALAAAVYPGPPAERILAVLAALALVGFAEGRLGWRRALIACIAGAGVAALAAAATSTIAGMIDADWAVDLATRPTFAPLTPSLAALMATSAVVGPLWRRRIRLLGFAAIVTLVLYDGRPSSVDALLGALVGLAIGRFLRRGSAPRSAWTRSTRHEVRILLSGLVALTALGPVITLTVRDPVGPLAPVGALFRARYHVGDRVLDRCRGENGFAAGTSSGGACLRDTLLSGLHGPGIVALSLLPLVVLLIAAVMIRRGSRLGVVVAIGVNILLAGLGTSYYALVPLASSTASGPHPDRFREIVIHSLSILVPATVAGILLVLLRSFPLRTPRRVRIGLALAVAGTFAVLLLGYLAIALTHLTAFPAKSSALAIALLAPQRFVPLGFIGPDNVGPLPAGGPARVAFDFVGAVFWLAFCVALLVAARREMRLTSDGDDRRRAVQIVRRGSTGALSHMATWPGTDYWFTDDRDAAVAFRRVGTTVITLGNPLGAAAKRGEAIAGFVAWCGERGLTPVFYCVTSELEPHFAALGWTTVTVAEETTISLADFSMRGKKWQDVRSSINRAGTNRVRAEWTRFGGLPASYVRQVEEISEEWVAGKRLPELGFTLGGIEEMNDPDVRLMLAVDGDDRVLAVTSWLPTFRDEEVVGWTLDFMRRSADSMNGVMEFLIASVALRAQEEGAEFVSLSAAPLATLEAPSAGSQTERLLDFIGRTLEPTYGFRSLLTFKLKFQPRLEPLLMAYADPLQLPRIGAALARAYLPTFSPRGIPALLRPGRVGE